MHLFFLEKRIITLSPPAHIKLDTTVHTKSHHFSLSSSRLYLFIYCLLHHTHFHHVMASEADQALLTAGNVITDDTKTASGVESEVVVASSSSNATIEKMVKKDVPTMTDY
jgi:hypothetical protein